MKSFVNAFLEVKPKVHFLMDFCGEEYDDLIKEVVPFNYTLEHTNLGINETCLRQYELAKEDNEIIYFAECDYLYRPLSGQTLVDGIQSLGLVSPYDHKNFYMDRSLHSTTCQIELVKDYHFRSVERNTMTFGVLPSVFRQYYSIFKKHGYLDGQVWYDLKEAGQKLWVPIPSLATHMAKDWMAPSVDWKYEV